MNRTIVTVDQQLPSETADATSKRLSAIGKYQLIARLGQGGMATVYLALVGGPGGFNKLLVVKVLRHDVMGGSDEGVRMFWNEARLAAQLVHPNIVHTFEVGQFEDKYFLAMEYLEGQTLRSLQDRAVARGGIPLLESLRILAEVARGLHYSHELKSFKGEPLGVVHRDVSPQNVFLTYDGQVKVLDFGIAKMLDSEHMTQVGVIKGKLEYLAPEQLKGEELDGRADVFALGAMLWEAVTGQRFAGGRRVADVAKVHTRLNGGERKVREVKPDTPDEIVALIERAIAVKASDRFPSAGAFADAIDSYLEGISSRPSPKTLAALMGPLYEADRAKMRLVIEEQIERSRSGQDLGGLEPPRIGNDPASSSGVFVSGGDDSGLGRADGTLGTGSERRVQPVPTPPKGARLPWIVALVMAMAAGAALIPWRGEAPAPPALPPQLPSPVAAATATPPQPSTTPLKPVDERESTAMSVLLDVKVTPADATVTLDGAPLATPFHGRFRTDSSFHLLEASAPGRRGFKRLIPFDSDQTLVIELPEAPAQPKRAARASSSDRRAVANLAPQAAPSPPREAPEPTKAAPPEVNEPGKEMTPGGSGIRRRALIVSDPYAPKP